MDSMYQASRTMAKRRRSATPPGGGAQVNVSTSRPTKRVREKGNGWRALKAAIEKLAECSGGWPLLKSTLDEQVDMMGYFERVEGGQSQLFELSGRTTAVYENLRPSEGVDTIATIVTSMTIEKWNATTDGLKSIQHAIQSSKSTLGRADHNALSNRERQRAVEMLEELVALLEDFDDDYTSASSLVDDVDDVDDPRRIQSQGPFSLHSVSTITDSTFNNIQGNQHVYNAPVYNTREINEQFKKLNHIAAAGIEAVGEEGCMEGTRVDLLHSLEDWSHNPDAPRIFWLVGPAGAGKSAIARSLARLLLRAGLLGGSFFCSRQTTVRSNARNIIPTLAQFMARLDTCYSAALADVLRPSNTDDVASWTIDRQIDKLLITPLQMAHQDETQPTRHRDDGKKLILVVDALDECAYTEDINTFLTQLLSIPTCLPIKVFIASRPEQHIRAHFESRYSPHDQHRILRLHEVEDEIVERDISLFLRQRLAAIRVSKGIRDDWPTVRQVEQLSYLSGTLFIYASTVVKFIQDENPVQRLDSVLESCPEDERPLNSNLDQMYALVLSDAMNPVIRREKEISATRRVLAAIIAAREPLSLATMSTLLCISDGILRSSLERIHAVVYVPDPNGDEAISIYHKSFADYLVSHERARPNIVICLDAGHSALAKGCLSVMRRELKFNISGCKSSYLPTAEQELLPIAEDLKYSCLHWSHHIVGASHSHTFTLLHYLDAILRTQFLFWVEVLGAERQLHLASSLLLKLLSWECIKQNPTAEYLRKALHDANEFVVAFKATIELSLPHIYLSALPLHFAQSFITETYLPQFRHLPQLITHGISGHSKTGFVIDNQSFAGCVAFSPNGRHIASGSYDKIRIWDVARGELVMQPIVGHAGTVQSAAFSPDGSLIVSCSWDTPIRVWDAVSGELAMPPLIGHTDSVNSVAFSPDGIRIVSGSSDQTIRVWDVARGELVMQPLVGHTDKVHSATFSPDGSLIVSCSRDTTIRVWDAVSGELAMPPLIGHTDTVNSAAFSPDASRIVSCSEDNTVRIWDAVSGALAMPPLTGHTDMVKSVAFSPSGRHIVSGSSDQTIRVWDVTSGALAMPPLTGHSSIVTSVAFSPDGSHIVSGSYDNTIRIWTIWETASVKPNLPPLMPLTGHTGRWVTWLAFSPDASRLVWGSDDKAIRVWDVASDELGMPPLTGHTGWVTSGAFSLDGSYIVSSSYDDSIRIWNAANGQLAMPPLTGHTGTVHSVAFSPDGSRIVSCSEDNTVRLWDAVSGALAMPPLTGHTDIVRCVKFSPSGRHIVSGSSDQTIRVWDAVTGELAMPPLIGHSSIVTSVAFSPDGSHIVSGSYDKTIRLWAAVTGAPAMPPLTGHAGTVHSVAFSPDGGFIVSGSYDKTIRVWDVASAQLAMPPLTGHTGPVSCVAFSPDGSQIASGSYDHTIRVWDVARGKLAMQSLTSHTALRESVLPLPLSRTSSCGMVSSPDHNTIRVLDLKNSTSFLSPCRRTWTNVPHKPLIYNFPHNPFIHNLMPEKDGWIRGTGGDLLLWLPPAYHNFLVFKHSCCIRLIAHSRVTVDVSDFVHGEDWTKCYTPVAHRPSSPSMVL
ncbi:hypothetical protein HGRIS_008788 [Hohenbuehelia grisea]|uniref:Nephrocystin 3-like N-terminal domain-containing protein n=1 Tax=Hohenbuehelia grisea TaxID=104357 RepID=A0ABR3J928_9AGAR